VSAAGNTRAARRRIAPPGPPTWPKDPRQDSFGNPTTKRPGDVGTELGFKHPGRKQKWRDMQGANKPGGSRHYR
jgi:hypothetical protein